MQYLDLNSCSHISFELFCRHLKPDNLSPSHSVTFRCHNKFWYPTQAEISSTNCFDKLEEDNLVRINRCLKLR